MNMRMGMNRWSMTIGIATTRTIPMDMGPSPTATHMCMSGCSTSTRTLRTFIIAMVTSALFRRGEEK